MNDGGVTPRAEAAARLRWSVLMDGPRSGAENMARDEALARIVAEAAKDTRRAGGVDALPAFLRFYAWERPTLSFGRNEPARARFDPERLAAAGVDVVRRPTGGRAVLHDREVTYSVVVPARALGGPRDTYRRVNEVLAKGLRTLGVDVDLAPEGPTAPLDAGPCFDRPAGGEVVARGRKLIGSAQARLGGALLQHGSILLQDDQGRIDELADDEGAASDSGPGAPVRPVVLGELLEPPPTFDAVVDVLLSAAEATLPGAWPAGVRRVDLEAADLVERHLDAEWIWRR